MDQPRSLLSRIWDCIEEDDLRIPTATGGMPRLHSRLAVDELLRDSIAAASITAAMLSDGTSTSTSLDRDRVRTAVTSERHFRRDGRAPNAWAELSGFWNTADGWLRTHANYPHHRDRLLGAIGLDAGADRDEFAARLLRFEADEAEERIADADGVAVKVRNVEEWRRHPHAAFVDHQPLVSVNGRRDAGSYNADPPSDRPVSPLSGVRVLDLTRVIAGPVATRTLALLGADVLRVDDPGLEEPEWQHLDTGAGKRTALLDLRSAADRAAFDELLGSADVLVTGYRPGALDRFGLSSEDLASRHPGVIVGRINAWGTDGPWAGRRGFDSIVQAATGIAWIESSDGEKPGALPAQALDHAAGYLLAAGILSALRHRRSSRSASEVGISLVRVAHELLNTEPASSTSSVDDAVPATTVTTNAGITYALPAIGYPGGPDDWPTESRPYGQDPPAWAAPIRG